MGLGDQEVNDEETETEGGDHGDCHEQVPVEEELVPEPTGMEDVGEPQIGGEDFVVEEVEPIGQESEEVVVTRTRKRKERIESSREGQPKKSRKDRRFRSSGSLAEITQALEGTREVQPYLGQMAYNMRHRSRDINVLEEVDPLAGVALAKEKLTRGDTEAKCQQLREAEENNRALSQRLEQVEQDVAVFRD
uniref:uncharacterized protein LOC105352474 isoform X2 n=1 Tax=Fragaria vesca subsp. vesca TaxID=101020 RepID=UPI0005C911D0|nr:PREDICTED: uncharacterized protein LOC105352474 isoform X2 [Fragaria vesca subsp. vesca]